MKYAIKLLFEVKNGLIRRIYGASGKCYSFRWDPALRAYVYQPTSQTEADDIFKTQTRRTTVYFAPFEPVTEQPEAPAGEGASPVSDELMQVCIQLGILVNEDDTTETVQRLVTAYSQGAGTEKPTRTVYENAMASVGLIPPNVPPEGFTAKQMEVFVQAYLAKLAAPAVAELAAAEPAVVEPATPKKKRGTAAPAENPQG